MKIPFAVPKYQGRHFTVSRRSKGWPMSATVTIQAWACPALTDTLSVKAGQSQRGMWTPGECDTAPPRRCCGERDIFILVDQARRLTVEWTANL
jgi:hypothetical protein